MSAEYNKYLPVINRSFKNLGLQLRPDAAAEVVQYVGREVKLAEQRSSEPINITSEVKATVDRIVSAIKSTAASSTAILDASAVRTALDSLAAAAALADVNSAAGADAGDGASTLSQVVTMHDGESRLMTKEEAALLDIAQAGGVDPRFVRVIDAYKMPAMEYAPSRQTYLPSHRTRSLHGTAVDKAKMFVERRSLVEQRLRRDPRFVSSIAARSATPQSTLHQRFEITRIEALLGVSGERCVFGMLTQLEDGVWFIEDENASIRADLSKFLSLEGAADLHGMFMDHCFVLAQGNVVNGNFIVSVLAPPPAETREQTVKAFPALDMCATQQNLVSLQRSKELLSQALTQHREDDRILILSDVRLDSPAVLKRLRKLFAGFEGIEPTVVVLMGSFASKEMIGRSRDLSAYTRLFDTLADIIAAHPVLAERTQFVLVPGPHDPNIGNVLPAPPLSASYTARLRSKVRNFSSSSNPTRLLYFGQELCFFRSDLQHRFRRAAVLMEPAADATRLVGLVAQTVCDQAHLSPMPLTKQPLVWNFDHALRLYPLPDVLVLGDVVEQVDDNYQGCHFVTPGSFADDGAFVCYLPAQKKTEFSCVN